MSPAPMPWLDPVPPWTLPPGPGICELYRVVPGDIPVMDLPPDDDDPNTAFAVRVGRYVPLAGEGPSRAAAVRALAIVVRSFGPGANEDAILRAHRMAFHEASGVRPLRALASAARAGGESLTWARAVFASVLVLGPDEALRERVARELTGVHDLSTDVSLALATGGEQGRFRQHYTLLMASPAAHTPPVRAARAFFDHVLARRFAGLDTLHALQAEHALDPSGIFLVKVADLVAGHEDARARIESHVATMLGPVEHALPGLLAHVAPSLARIVAHPLALRLNHLRCAVARDHAARALRTWLADAMLPLPEDDAGPMDSLVPSALSAEPSRAARAVVDARLAANAFLHDWLVPVEPARRHLDDFAAEVFALYHRLRGVQLYVEMRAALTPAPGAPRSAHETLVWGAVS